MKKSNKVLWALLLFVMGSGLIILGVIREKQLAKGQRSTQSVEKDNSADVDSNPADEAGPIIEEMEVPVEPSTNKERVSIEFQFKPTINKQK